jgi:hypothetical protein
VRDRDTEVRHTSTKRPDQAERGRVRVGGLPRLRGGCAEEEEMIIRAGTQIRCPRREASGPGPKRQPRRMRTKLLAESGPAQTHGARWRIADLVRCSHPCMGTYFQLPACRPVESIAYSAQTCVLQPPLLYDNSARMDMSFRTIGNHCVYLLSFPRIRDIIR